MGDDFGGDARPKATAEVLTNLKGGTVRLTVNGTSVGSASVRNGLFVFNIPADLLHKGLNAFAVAFPAEAPAGSTFNDFVVKVVR